MSGGVRARRSVATGQTWCGPRRSTEKARRCLRSSRRILSSSESGSSGLLYSSSSTSFSEVSPPAAPGQDCVELGSDALFFRHLVRRFWNHTCRGAGRVTTRSTFLIVAQSSIYYVEFLEYNNKNAQGFNSLRDFLKKKISIRSLTISTKVHIDTLFHI